MTVVSKECARCASVKPLTAYHKAPTASDKRAPMCKACAWQSATEAAKRGLS